MVNIVSKKLNRCYKKYIKDILPSLKNTLDFTPDGRLHYVYRVTDKTRTYKMHYIGSRTSKNTDILEDFWSYKTSSKYNTLDENKKYNYKIKIIKVFDNPTDKILYESFLHQYFNVKKHPSFWNESNQTPNGFDRTGIPHTKETKEKISLSKTKKVIINNKETTSAIEGALKAKETLMNSPEIVKNRTIKYKETRNAKDNFKSGAKKRIESINKKDKWDEIGFLISNSLSKIQANGKTVAENRGPKISSSKNKIIMIDGKETTSAIEGSKKRVKNWSQEDQEKRNASYIKTRKLRAKRYNVLIDGRVIYENLMTNEVNKLSTALIKKTKNNPLGNTTRSKSKMKSSGNANLIGAYVELVVP